MAEAAKPAERRKISKGLVLFGVAWCAVLFGLYAAGVLESADWKFNDFVYNSRGLVQPSTPVFLVKIDDDSLKRVGQYPWPRKVYARLVNRLTELGVKTVAFDVLFLEKSPSSEGDREFAAALARAKNVILGCSSDPHFSKVFNQPIPELRKAAAGVGFVNMPYLDRDSQIRAVATRLTDESGNTVPVLSVAALAQFNRVPVETFYDKVPEVLLINLLGEMHEKQKLADGNTLVRDDIAFPAISAADILDNHLSDKDRAVIKGGLAFVGSTATGAFDHYPSPFTDTMPGVLVHMTTVDNIVTKGYFRTGWGALSALLIVAGILLAFWLVPLSPLISALSTLGLILAWSAFCWFEFLHRYSLEWSPFVVAIASTYVVLLVKKALTENKEKRYIKSTFKQYLSPDVVEILAKDPSKLRLGGEMRDLSIMFLDIAHFTTISEKLQSEDLVKFLNLYLTDFTDVILSNKGTVDKYIGDCVMAFWNAPLDVKDHRRLACLSAVQCIEAINRLNAKVDLPKDMPEMPAIRVGVNAGLAHAGNFGSNQRFGYTIIGDEVNLASRLEGANKFFGSSIMASEAAFKGAAEEAVVGRPLGRVKVVGKDIPILVYELVGEKGKVEPAKLKMLEAYDEGIEHYLARRFDKALQSFEQGLALVPKDGPCRKYKKVCEEFHAAPPGKDWDGVWELTSK